MVIKSGNSALLMKPRLRIQKVLYALSPRERLLLKCPAKKDSYLLL